MTTQRYGCGCGSCTVDSIAERGCPFPTDEQLPILLLDPEHRLRDEDSELASETNAIVELFQECVRKTWISLYKQKVDIVMVKVALLSHIGSLRNSSELASAKDFPTLLKLLGDCQSWFNFKILHNLANELLADVGDVCSLWKEYSSKLDQYVIGRTIRDYDGVMFGASESKQHKRVYFRIDDQFGMQVTDLHALRSSLSVILRCPRQHLYFVTVHCSDIVLEFLIPLPLYEDLFPLSLEQLRELASIGVTAVETDVFKAINLTQLQVCTLCVIA